MSNQPTAAKARPDIHVELGGKTRRLVFTLEAINILEQYAQKEFGVKSIWEGFNWKQLSAQEITRIIWACLLTDEPDIKYTEVERMCDFTAIIGLAEGLVAAVMVMVENAMPLIDTLSDEKKMVEFQRKVRQMFPNTNQPTGSSFSESESSNSDSPPKSSGD